MRVAYICADAGVPVFGRKGCSIHVQEFVRALVTQGAEVRLYAARIGGIPGPDLDAVAVRELPAQRGAGTAIREQAAVSANREIQRMLERDGPFDLVYERYSLFSYSAMEYARRYGAPGVLEVNAPLIEEQSQYRTLIDRQGAEAAARRVFGGASMIIAVSDEVAAYLTAFPQARGRVQVTPNGVDTRRFRPRRNPAAAKENFTVGFVGSLKPWHGLESLVPAFAALTARAPQARLLIVGDGPEREALEAALSDHGIRNAAAFTGAVSHDEVPELLTSIDVAVAPYPKLSHFYFSPLKIYEYMAAGLAVVASRSGQVAKLIEDGVTGLLYEPGDMAGLLEALDRLRREPQFRLSLGRAARAAVVRDHTWDGIVKHVLESCGLRPAGNNLRAGVTS